MAKIHPLRKAKANERKNAPLNLRLEHIPLLKREEEIELASLIKKGGKAGSTARKKFIESNIRLVIKIATDYTGYGLELEDLVSEGCIGLAIAVDKFDSSHGNKFSTYGSWWIRQKITRALPEKGRLIRLPIYISQRQAKVFRFEEDFRQRRGRSPTNKETAKELGLTVANVEAAIKTRECVATSLDREICFANNSESHRTFGELLEDGKAVSPLTSCEHFDDANVVRKCLNELEERERFIVANRFGFGIKGKRTLEDIGRDLKITRERVRQIESKALKRLRILLKKKL